MHAMVDWAVRNRLLVVLGLIAALIVLVFSLQKLNVDAFPKVRTWTCRPKHRVWQPRKSNN